jgi:hypothetical protein
MNKIQKQTNEIVDYARLTIAAMVCIWVIFMVAKELVGDVPAKIGSIILGIAGIFIFATSKKVRNEMLSWGHGKIK